MSELTAADWQQFCGVMPPLDGSVQGCQTELEAALNASESSCEALSQLDWSTCAATVGQNIECWYDAIDHGLCTRFRDCLPSACP